MLWDFRDRISWVGSCGGFFSGREDVPFPSRLYGLIHLEETFVLAELNDVVVWYRACVPYSAIMKSMSEHRIV